MDEKLVALWSHVKEYYTLRIQLAETRRVYTSYNATSYKGRETNRYMMHTQHMFDRVLEKMKAEHFMEEFNNIRTTLEKFEHYEAEIPEIILEVVTCICEQINRRLIRHTPNFYTYKQAATYHQKQLDQKCTVQIGEGGVHEFELYPFKWLDRRIIIDEILKDLESQ